MVFSTNRGDIIGLAKTELDAHTLGISAIEEILNECGFNTVVSDSQVSKAFSDPQEFGNSSLIREWIRKNSITVLGFSYRLNCDDAILIFQKLMYQLEVNRVLADSGGPLKKVCFAGLPEAAKRIQKK